MSGADAWIEALEEGLANVRAGQTFREAFSQIPNLRGEAAEAARWQAFAGRVTSGRLSAEAGLVAWLQELRLRRRVQRLAARKTALPRLQARVLGALALLLLLLSQFLFPAELRPKPGEFTLSCALVAAALGSMHALIARFTRRLWDLDWLLFLARVDAGLAWGAGPAAAWSEAWDEVRDAAWPAVLRARVDSWIQGLRSGQPRPPEAVTDSDPALARALAQLKRLTERIARGLESRPLLRAFAENGWEAAEARAETEGERLGLQLLAPLFLALVPALLLPLWAPVWRLISGAGPS
jgi:hypothetical protein